jgi:hypothetical protein
MAGKAVPTARPDSEEAATVVRGANFSLRATDLRRRRAEAENIDTDPASFVPRPRDVAIANAVVHFEDEDHVVRVISNLWREAQAKFLAIGRNLREAKRRYPKAFERTILPQLPFGRQVAYQLRGIAEAVDGRRFSESELPMTYSAAYQLAIMDDGDLKQARQDGLIRPDIQRRRIEEWKRQRELHRRLEREGKEALLREERQRLRDEGVRLRDRLSAIASRLAEINEEIGAEEDGVLTIEGRAEEVSEGQM